MVKVQLRQKNPADESQWITKEIYLDGYLKSNLDAGIELLHKDFDQVWFVDGGEGNGKTDLAVTCAYYVNKEETRHNLFKRVCPTAEIFEQRLLEAEPFEAVVLDEGFGGMSSSGAMGKVNRVLQRRFTEIRAKNLFVFIIAPSFMDIMRYFAIWRSKVLLHVYLGQNRERGYCAFFNEDKKRKLYILGKKAFYSYGVVAPNFTFRFVRQMYLCIDKAAYDAQKRTYNLSTQEVQLSTASLKKKVLKEVIQRINKHPATMNLQIVEKCNLMGISDTTYHQYCNELKENEGNY